MALFLMNIYQYQIMQLMYRFLPIFLFSFLIALNTNAQVNIKGVLKASFNNYGVGDTVVFTCAKEVGSNKQLHYWLKSTNDLLPANQIELLLNDLNFWEIQQFYYSHYEIETKGWQTDTRKKMEKKTLNLLARLANQTGNKTKHR
jgi:hypothetical protein